MKKRHWVTCSVAVRATDGAEAQALLDAKLEQIDKAIQNMGDEFRFSDMVGSFAINLSDGMPLTDDDEVTRIPRSRFAD